MTPRRVGAGAAGPPRRGPSASPWPCASRARLVPLPALPRLRKLIVKSEACYSQKSAMQPLARRWSSRDPNYITVVCTAATGWSQVRWSGLGLGGWCGRCGWCGRGWCGRGARRVWVVGDVRAVGSASAKDGLTKQRDKRRRAHSPSRPTAARVDLSSGGLLAVARSAAAHEDGTWQQRRPAAAPSPD